MHFWNGWKEKVCLVLNVYYSIILNYFFNTTKFFKLINSIYKTKRFTTILINFLISVSFLFISFYFIFNAIYGSYGLKKNIALEIEIIELNNKLSSLQKVLYDIEKKTSSLSKKNLDLDLLDEQSRKILGLIRHDEIMLIEK